LADFGNLKWQDNVKVAVISVDHQNKTMVVEMATETTEKVDVRNTEDKQTDKPKWWQFWK